MKPPALEPDWKTPIANNDADAGRVSRFAESFGRLTFNRNAMEERLSKSVCERLINTIDHNEPLDPEIADEVAHAMKEWALSLGATHFCHWFQPLRGVTAEKHDAFLSVDGKGAAIERFSGKQLTQGEPDASSFPSGGMRSTFEARGYTAWDPTSPAFILKNGSGATLVIPSVYLSFTGEVLDRKTPLLRALRAVEDQAFKMLKLFGNRTARQVRLTLGPEQEYFLISKELYLKRPDLIFTGRTLLGLPSAKHQQMEDHYFGEIKPKVLRYMAAIDSALVERGIPAKTRHNEVAPNQFELAVLYEEGNLAVDHNLQAMEIMRRIADEQGLAILLHEKPFAGINGSGKHLNWSMMDSDGNNLLEPGPSPKKNIQFLTFIAGILEGAEKYGQLLRASVADAGNDHRLGANEAPPAILSVYLGEYLDKLFNEIEKGLKETPELSRAIDHGLKRLPAVMKDNSDRNRTSPFAFTGNKFEFRAVGASQSCSEPAVAVCLAVAYGLETMAQKIEKETAKGAEVTQAAMSAIREAIRRTKRIRFEGNNYSPDWHKEAAGRGLPDLKDTPSAIRVFIEPEVVGLFERYKVLTKEELHALYEIKLEAYVKTKEIEIRVLKELAQTHIIPSLAHHAANTGAAFEALNSAVKAGGRSLKGKLSEIDNVLNSIDSGIQASAEALERYSSEKSHAKAARYLADNGGATLSRLRQACDQAEETTERALWPLPTYGDMLFLL